MSSTIGEARQVRIDMQPGAAVARRRWPDSTPPPTVTRGTLEEVVSKVQVQPRSSGATAAKRALDVIGGVTGLVVFAPVLLIVAVLVRLTSKGPALFVQDRCGVKGRTFRFFKFRTMVVDAEDRKADLAHLNEMSGPVFKIAQDPRITRFGAFLRKSSLDELPQLWNVIKGDMSLVGPRPPLPEEVECYDSLQAQRLSVKPGITGLWQVSGRSSIQDFETWVALDLEYARSWTIWLDLKILARTFVAVVTAKGAA